MATVDQPSPPSTTRKVTMQHKLWSATDMEGALRDVEDNYMSIRGASRKWGIPIATLSKWLGGLTTTSKKGPPTILTYQEEEQIVQWCQEMASCGHGLEIINLKAVVSQICEGRQTSFKDGMPCNSWRSGFKARRRELSLWTVVGLNKDRALCLRPTVVSSFYETLSKAYAANPYGPAHIWNYDETRVMASKNGAMRVLARKGSRNISYILLKSHDWITILCYVNASGQSIPGFYLFKGKRRIQNYIGKCEPGARMATKQHVWMTKELFTSCLHHFKHSVPRDVSPMNRCLLIFDGHDSHVALSTIQEARMLGIDLLTLPTHTSHKLQSLDVSVFSPFKTYFKSERVAWIERFPNLEIRRVELAELSSKSLAKALTISNITTGFKRTGIWPLNYDALTQDM
ncbi:MFS-type transporter clz9-like [Cryptomeria japonica]|uniref:MFS-type transporter clz9-like n=1 Tax=Cryptomeria japonica TaxID=3369 RepID=UPI0027DA7836|nr:MFS-type transporter clz9-like [Cryptomeria japonica]